MSVPDRSNEVRRTEKKPEAHPAAELFPMLDDDDMRVLAEDIKTNGLRQPIVLTPDGLVLDGRNRLTACELAGVEPTFITYDGDPVAFVISANVHRRHMTTGQLAAATALALIGDGKRRGGRWARGSVPANGEISNSAWAKAMSLAGELADLDPTLTKLRDVVADGHSLTYAVAEARDTTVAEIRAIEDAKEQALDFVDDEALAERIARAYVAAPNRHGNRYLILEDVVHDLDYFEASPAEQRKIRRQRREERKQAEKAEEAAELAEWEALSDDDKVAVVAFLNERSRLARVNIARLFARPVDPDAEVRNIASAINATVEQFQHSYKRLAVYTGLPHADLRSDLTANLLEREVPERVVELLWRLVDDE